MSVTFTPVPLKIYIVCYFCTDSRQRALVRLIVPSNLYMFFFSFSTSLCIFWPQRLIVKKKRKNTVFIFWPIITPNYKFLKFSIFFLCTQLERINADHHGSLEGTTGKHTPACSQTSCVSALHQLCEPCSNSPGTLQT